MLTIWKSPALSITDAQPIKVRLGAKILKIGLQHGVIHAWFLLDDEQPVETRTIRIYGTGHEVSPLKQTYLDTVFVAEDQLVFHIFEIVAPKFEPSPAMIEREFAPMQVER